MNATIITRRAGKKDYAAICQLLAEANLPTSDINPLLEDFVVALENNSITGVMGMDKYGDAGLLRSAVVAPQHRNTGIASTLINQLIKNARRQGVITLYLITNTAEKYFATKGFKKIAKNEVPATVLQSKEFNGLCPASSVIMFRQL